MIDAPTVWMRGPWGQGEPQEVEATPDVLLRLMRTGWSQCEPPEAKPEVKNVDH